MKDFHHYLFFADDITTEIVSLDAGEARHAAQVLRIQAGDRLHITNGCGQIATGIVERIGKYELVVQIAERTTIQRQRAAVHLFIGLPERDAFERVLSDATALGVCRIVPVIADFCQKGWWQSQWEKQEERYRQKMIVAMKQSQYPYIPELTVPYKVDAAVAMATGLGIVADPEGKPLQESLQESISCYIGPPGGFSPREQDLFVKQEISGVQIANARLRTELATVVLLSQIAGRLL